MTLPAPPRPSTAGYLAVLATLLVLAAAAGSAGCLSGGTEDRAPPHERTAVVTVLPQAEVVREIAGGEWTVLTVVPPGVEPHTYEPTASQVSAVSRADAYFRLGPGLMPFEDALLERVTAQAPGIVVIDMSGGVSVLHGDSGGDGGGDREGVGVDPHIWLSPENLRTMAENVARGLSEIDPANAGAYSARKNAYIAKIDACTDAIRNNLTGLEGRAFLVFHPALGYFARDFGLVQVAVEEEGREPGPAGLSRLVTYARDHGISVIFVEPQFSTRESEVIAREINGTVATIDPLAPDVLENLVRISGAIAGSYRAE